MQSLTAVDGDRYVKTSGTDPNGYQVAAFAARFPVAADAPSTSLRVVTGVNDPNTVL